MILLALSLASLQMANVATPDIPTASAEDKLAARVVGSGNTGLAAAYSKTFISSMVKTYQSLHDIRPYILPNSIANPLIMSSTLEITPPFTRSLSAVLRNTDLKTIYMVEKSKGEVFTKSVLRCLGLVGIGAASEEELMTACSSVRTLPKENRENLLQISAAVKTAFDDEPVQLAIARSLCPASVSVWQHYRSTTGDDRYIQASVMVKGEKRRCSEFVAASD